jgi:hypothetical protein
VRTIEIVVSPTGETKITTRGYSGNECQEATRRLEAALGKKSSDQPTPEMFGGLEQLKQEARQ